MKKIYIIRHAKADSSYPELTDFERPITPRGRADAPRMGIYLKSINLHPDLIYSSPANRAITTARIVAYQLGYSFEKISVKELIYDASVEDLLRVIKKTEDTVNTLMIFGHNPGLSYLAQYLTDEKMVSLSTCNVFGIELKNDVYTWKDIYPDSGKCILDKSPKELS